MGNGIVLAREAASQKSMIRDFFLIDGRDVDIGRIFFAKPFGIALISALGLLGRFPLIRPDKFPGTILIGAAGLFIKAGNVI